MARLTLRAPCGLRSSPATVNVPLFTHDFPPITPKMPPPAAMLTNVVKNGTGVNAQIDGYTVAGKTGTARKNDLEHGVGILPVAIIVVVN